MVFKFQEIILVLVEVELEQGEGKRDMQAREGAWTRMAAIRKEDRFKMYLVKRSRKTE